ncbi:MAG: thioredoxin family protein [Candidatus Parabeggiatoa sp. nov. 3]|nr:MAG: thioredoxin family protein [Gammaproteobacteria bacterium]RKZ69507.1 MAG: thioredoxin family protein [Gammaproteobacteria bacterium]RKZ90121.1 MAG: thioredoxin family protein [Gammaproteobacteria bacterium]
MASTPSTMMPLGTTAPDFSLLNTVTGDTVTLQTLKSDTATVIMFICNHCPYVKHVQGELVKLAKDYQPKGIAFIAINANDVVNYPDDSPDKMKVVAQQLGYSFPYLYDETQEVAKAYQAACTPDFYVFDKDLKCVYRGQLDDARPRNDAPVTGKDIRVALDAILAGEPVNPEQIPSIGCNIKWK